MLYLETVNTTKLNSLVYILMVSDGRHKKYIHRFNFMMSFKRLEYDIIFQKILRRDVGNTDT